MRFTVLAVASAAALALAACGNNETAANDHADTAAAAADTAADAAATADQAAADA